MGLFVPNPRFEAEMRRTPEHLAGLKDIGEAVASQAELILTEIKGPWLLKRGRQGPIVVVEERGEVAVANTDSAAHWQEWGSRNNPPHAVLRRAVSAVGLRLKEDRG